VVAPGSSHPTSAPITTTAEQRPLPAAGQGAAQGPGQAGRRQPQQGGRHEHGEKGDHEARGLIVAGFFGDLTNADLYADSDKGPAGFVPWLGPQPRNLDSVKRLV
jgi:hypothetical protein